MKNKAVKVKVSDEQIVEQISKGLNNKQILDCLKLSSSGTSYKRLNKLRNQLPFKVDFDLQVMDTVTKEGKWYRITEIGEESFTIKRIYGDSSVYGYTDTEDISKEDYMSGRTNLIKRELPPVKCYVDESLKKPATINKDFDDAIKEMIAKNKEEKESTTEIYSKLGQASTLKPNNLVQGKPINLVKEDDISLGLIMDKSKLARKIVDGAKMQISEFVKAKESIVESLTAEIPINIEALDVYNMLLEKYEG